MSLWPRRYESSGRGAVRAAALGLALVDANLEMWRFFQRFTL